MGQLRSPEHMRRISDDGGQFLRLPIGHPALAIVRPDTPALRTQEGELNERPSARRGKEMAELLRKLEKSRQDARRLVERGRELYSQLSSLCGADAQLLGQGFDEAYSKPKTFELSKGDRLHKWKMVRVDDIVLLDQPADDTGCA